jgi:hypothetical protein
MPPPTDTTARPTLADVAPAPPTSALPGAPALVLALSLAVAAGAATVGLASVAGAPESRQTVAYVVYFFVFLPLAVAAGVWFERRLARLPAPTAAILSATAAMGALAVVLAARLVTAAGGAAAPILIGGVAVWCLGGAVAWRGLRAQRRPATVRPRLATTAWAATAVLAGATILGFVPDRLRGPVSLAISLAVGVAVMALVLGSERISTPRWLGAGADALVVGLILLALVDASSFLPHLPYNPVVALGSPFGADRDLIVITHQSFYLGPVTDVLHGNAMLVDTFCQYGVGVIYFLAIVFSVAPLGYGPLALVSGGLTGLAFAAAYVSLRLAGCRRVTAAIALAVGIAATQMDVLGSAGDLPSTGALRFGPAYLLILVVVARARWVARARGLRALELAVVGLSAIWSLEALGYALAIALAAEAVEAAMSGGSWRARARRWILGAAWALGATVAAIAVLTVLTRLLSGQWPDWSPYIALLTLYSGRTVPNVVTFPSIAAWSSGFAVGFVYVASAVTTAWLTSVDRLRPELRARLVAAAAFTAFGILSLSYWITHGVPIALRTVALPAVLLGALWVDLAVGARWLAPRIRLGGLAMGSLVVALMAVFAWPQAEKTGDRTALIHALPGSPSLRQDVGSLWHSPRLDPRALEGEALLRRYAPGHRAVVMLAERDLGLEILMRSGRASAVPLGYPLQSDLISEQMLPRVRRAVDRLKPGTLALVQVGRSNGGPRPQSLRSILLDRTAALLQRRFAPRLLATTRNGLALVRFEQRRSPSGRS